MNRKLTLALALMAVTALPPVFAQAPAPNTAATAPPAGSPREPARPPAVRGAATNADARLCLELPTNLQIIKCAEKYLLHRRRG